MQFGTPSSAVSLWRSKPFAIVVAVFAILSLLLVGATYQPATHAQSTNLNWTYASTNTSTVTPKAISPNLYKSSSLSAQQAAQIHSRQQAELDKLGRLPRPTPQHIAKVGNNIAPSTNMEFPSPKQLKAAGSNAAGDGIVEQNVNAAGAICSSPCRASYVQEPSVAGNGKYLWQTGNWYSGYSSNGGSSWSALNPFSDPNFCCDQTVTYEPSRNVFIWETLDVDFGLTGSGNAVNLFIFTGQLSGLCEYTFTSSSIGMAADQLTDYPKVAIGTDDTYLTWNTYNEAGNAWENSALLRLPTDSLASCSGFNFNYLTRTDVFTFDLVSGSTEGMNWGSPYCTSACTAGSQMEFYNWSESASGYGILTLNLNPYTFNGGGQNCGSVDTVVSNWCGFEDSRGGTGAYLSRSGYRGFGGQVISFAISAGAGGSFPQTYVVREYFVLPTMTYKGNDNLWNPDFGIAYPGCADSPYFGHVACTFSIGGGVGTGSGAVDLYPSTAGFMEDKQWKNQPWFDYYLCVGSGNAPSDRWGDYTTTREWSDGEHWLQADWCMSNNSGGVNTYSAIVGESRNHSEYLTWIGR